MMRVGVMGVAGAAVTKAAIRSAAAVSEAAAVSALETEAMEMDVDANGERAAMVKHSRMRTYSRQRGMMGGALSMRMRQR